MILNFLENLFCSPRLEDNASVLLEFPNGTEFRVKDAYEGIGVIGSIGSGKTSLAATIRQALLGHLFGLLVLCVKTDEADEWEKQVKKAGRQGDFVRFRADGQHRFNPFSHSDPLTVVAFLEDFASMLHTGKDKSPFWQGECTKIARNAAVIAYHANGQIDLGVMAGIIATHAGDPDQVHSKTWQERSSCFQLLQEAEKRSPGNLDVLLAKEFFLETFPSYDPKTRGNVLAVVGNLLEGFRREPLRTLFSGNSTVTPQDILQRRKIVCIDVPVLDDKTVGTIANGVWLYAFCRASTKKMPHYPAALYIDEAQFLISGELMRAQTVIRYNQVGSILLSQNLAVMEECLSPLAVEGLLSTLNTMIFTRQSHARTRQWAADFIDKIMKTRKTKNHSRNYGRGGGSSASESEEQVVDYKFQPFEFAKLKTGGKENGYKVESIVLAGAKAFRAKWHQLRPGAGGTVKPKY